MPLKSSTRLTQTFLPSRIPLGSREVSCTTQRVGHSYWAALIVVVLEKHAKFRICENYKVTVSGALNVDQCPLPKPINLLVTLAGGQTFIKLDLSQAYRQLLLQKVYKKEKYRKQGTVHRKIQKILYRKFTTTVYI